MAVELIAQALDSELPPTERFVLVVLADHAGRPEDGGPYVCWPSVPTLARRTGFSKRTVQNALNELKRRGIVAVLVAPAQHKSTRYVIVPSCIPMVERPVDNRSPAQLQGRSSFTPETAKLPFRGAAPAPEPSGLHLGPQSSTSSSARPAPSEELSPYGILHRALMERFHAMMGRPPSGGEGAAWGRVAREMAQAEIRPEEVTLRALEFRRRKPKLTLNPHMLWRMWGEVDPASEELENRRVRDRLRKRFEGDRDDTGRSRRPVRAPAEDVPEPGAPAG